MTDTKYGKYIVTRPKERYVKNWNSAKKLSTFMDDKIVKGAFYFSGIWCYKASKVPEPAHVHDDWDECIGFLGTNFENPFDLGGEVELWLGGEKHIITETCIVFVPAGLEHCPVYFRRVDSPIWFYSTGPKKKYTLRKKA